MGKTAKKRCSDLTRHLLDNSAVILLLVSVSEGVPGPISSLFSLIVSNIGARILVTEILPWLRWSVSLTLVTVN